jgi:hypothetical protein
MGFLDKAKQLANQAQQKLDEVQKDFNKSQTAQDLKQGGPAPQYDKHGRPITPSEPEAPAAPPARSTAPAPDPAAPAPAPDPATPPPATDPAAPAPTPDPAATTPEAAGAPPAPTDATAPSPTPAPPPAEPNKDDSGDEGGPPKMTSGDPLAG